MTEQDPVSKNNNKIPREPSTHSAQVETIAVGRVQLYQRFLGIGGFEELPAKSKAEVNTKFSNKISFNNFHSN